ncbi:MAG: glutamate-1-semialdehyde 2,1-aminomutase [Ignavibacteriales bacterium]|nr:glutamate-1-semialdehyde 2,1-aminomutase [Ignavibacteriales bacterium]
MKSTKSIKLFENAKKFIPGGVNSPVRAFKSVGITPRFIARAKGANLWDVDGNKYIDYIGSWGPMILGHSHPSIIKAIREKAKHGTSFGAPTELEVKIAQLITNMVPSIEMLRMVNSGTEATMSAIRLARAYTGREKIIKFDGCYHGHADSFLIKAGSGATTFGTPDSPGVTKSTAADTLNAAFNNIDSVKKIVAENKNQIAAIIVEPIVGNMGCIPPKNGFLESLRSICTKENIVLIFDEVMTGFRVAPGGAQELYKIKPDLTTLGKIIGGGLPVGAYGGKREIMEMVAPNGPMYQAGTLSGNPLAMAAGFEMLSILDKNKSIYKHLEQSSKHIEEGFKENFDKLNLNFVVNRVGSMFTLFFTNKKVTDADSARSSDTKLFGSYFREMLDSGIYLPPSQFEAAFVSIAHTDEMIDKTVRANFKSLKSIFKR